jgi:hypothetical protein
LFIERMTIGVALAACLLSAGCSIMGFVFSQSLRADNPKTVGLSGGELRELAVGSQLRGKLFDGRSFGGRLVSFVAEDDAAYDARYHLWQAEDGAWAPRPGESIQVVGDTAAVGYFEAFDFDGLWLRGRTDAIGLQRVERIQIPERDLIVSGDALREAASAGELPYRSRLCLSADGQRADVRSDRIARIATLGSSPWTWTPVALGLALDIAFIRSIDTWN